MLLLCPEKSFLTSPATPTHESQVRWQPFRSFLLLPLKTNLCPLSSLGFSSKRHIILFTCELFTTPESIYSPGTLYLKVGEPGLVTLTWNPSTQEACAAEQESISKTSHGLLRSISE